VEGTSRNNSNIRGNPRPSRSEPFALHKDFVAVWAGAATDQSRTPVGHHAIAMTARRAGRVKAQRPAERPVGAH
jgi:hypothetical protein